MKILPPVLGIALGMACAVIPAASAAAAPLPLSVSQSSNRGDELQRDRRGRVERRGDRYYFRGNRGYRYKRPGYRRFDGFWFPPAAFLGGIWLGDRLDYAPPRRVRGVDAHERWCLDRYVSYDIRSDTYQPYDGPRRYCNSPYS